MTTIKIFGGKVSRVMGLLSPFRHKTFLARTSPRPDNEKDPTEAEVLGAFTLHQRRGLTRKELGAKVKASNRNLMQDFAQKTGVDYALIEKELGDLKYIDVLGLVDADYCLFHLKRCWKLPETHRVTNH